MTDVLDVHADARTASLNTSAIGMRAGQPLDERALLVGERRAVAGARVLGVRARAVDVGRDDAVDPVVGERPAQQRLGPRASTPSSSSSAGDGSMRLRARPRREPPSGRIAITATPSSARERQELAARIPAPRVVRHLQRPESAAVASALPRSSPNAEAW